MVTLATAGGPPQSPRSSPSPHTPEQPWQEPPPPFLQISLTQNCHPSENNLPRTLSYVTPYSPHADNNDARVVLTMNDATHTIHPSTALAPSVSNTSTSSAFLSLRRPQVPITTAIDQHCRKHSILPTHGRIPPSGASMPTPTHAIPTILSHHKNTSKTTEKLSLSLHNLHGDYHNIPTNHNHHIPSVISASSINRSTMDRLPTIESRTKSPTSVHHTTATTQSLRTSSISNSLPSPISSRPDIRIGSHRKPDNPDDSVPHTLAPSPNETDDLSSTNKHFPPTEFTISSDRPEKSPANTHHSTLDSTADNSFEACMRQQQSCFLATLAEI